MSLRVIEGGAREPFKGELILRAAAEFVDEAFVRLSSDQRIDAIDRAARIIVDAELDL